MLAGIYYGAQYGDSVSAITMKIPHASSIVACIDGYQMTLNGQDGPCALHRRRLELHRRHGRDRRARGAGPGAGRGGAPVRACRLLRAHVGGLRVRELRDDRQPASNGLAMCLVGVLLGQIGTDVNSGVQRFTMGLPFLYRRRRPGEHGAGLLRHRRDHEEPRQP